MGYSRVWGFSFRKIEVFTGFITRAAVVLCLCVGKGGLATVIVRSKGILRVSIF